MRIHGTGPGKQTGIGDEGERAGTRYLTNPLARECLGELMGTFVLLMFGCSASAQVKTSRETKGQYLSANMAFSVGVMSAMYLCKGVSGKPYYTFHPKPTPIPMAPWVKLLPYTLCQVLGAYLASGLVFLVYYDAIMDFSGGNLTVYGANETASIFATYLSEHLSLRAPISQSTYLSEHLSLRAPISQSTYLSEHLSLRAPISQSTYLSAAAS
uniref:aquaporin-3-like n=1 Tax=Oncorhynchus gorbuscha TaxID=8017 RepID=UPI001EAE90A9|nr:aquaporin-3-like [Oncorhynchus gorbuscha]